MPALSGSLSGQSRREKHSAILKTSMKFKRKSAAAAAVLGAGALVAGTLAFFTDTETEKVEATVGTLDLDIQTNMLHTNAYEQTGAAANNINPGDNDFDNEEPSRDGTDHEIVIGVENKGNKSMITRTLLFVTGTKKGDANTRLSTTDLGKIDLYLNKTQNGKAAPTETITDDTATLDPSYANADLLAVGTDMEKMVATNAAAVSNQTSMTGLISTIPGFADAAGYTADENNTLLYLINNNMVLSGQKVDGTDGAVETETVKTAQSAEQTTAYLGKTAAEGNEAAAMPVKKTFVVEVGLDKEVTKDAPSLLEGADLEFIVVVQAMQFRNTSDNTWKTVFVSKTNAGA